MAFIQTRNNLIRQAGIDCGVIGPNDNFDSVTIDTLADRFHMVMASLEAMGAMDWNVTETFVALDTPSSTVANNNSFYRSIKGALSNLDNEPGVGKNWRIFWVEEGTSGPAWVGSMSYTSNNEVVPDVTSIEIDKIFMQRNSEYHPICFINYTEFARLGDDIYRRGIPRFAFIEIGNTFVNSVRDKTIRLYPHPEDADFILHYRFISSNVESETDSAAVDIPKAWYLAIVKSLCAEIAQIYQHPRPTVTSLQREARRLVRDQLVKQQRASRKIYRVKGFY